MALLRIRMGVVTAALLSVVLVACAPYRPAQVGNPTGYSERKLAEGIYSVEFRGGGASNREAVERYFLYRCAELTKQNGYKYFSVLLQGQTPPPVRPATPTVPVTPPAKTGQLDDGGWSQSVWMDDGLPPKAGLRTADFNDANAGRFEQVRSRGGGTTYYYVPGAPTYTTYTVFIGRGTVTMYKDAPDRGAAKMLIGWAAEDVLQKLGPFIKDARQKVDMPKVAFIDTLRGPMAIEQFLNQNKGKRLEDVVPPPETQDEPIEIVPPPATPQSAPQKTG